MDESHLELLRCYLKNLTDASCDFGEYAKERGMTRKDNAMTGFKNMIKKYGLTYDGKKFVAIEGDGDNQTAPTTSSPAKKATPRKRKVKVEENAGGENGEISPKKKTTRKGKKEVTKVETADNAAANGGDNAED